MDEKDWKKISLLAAAAAVAAAAAAFLPARNPAVLFTIEPGQSLTAVGRRLSDQQLIFSRFLFDSYAILTGREKKFKAGKYRIPANSSTAKLVFLFADGKPEPEGMLVTIPEGMNAGEIAQLLEGKRFKNLNISEFIENEGYLFPDSYWFKGDETSGEIIQKMKENFEEKTRTIFKYLNILKQREAIIIASLLEKEVRKPEDRRLVAGIIYKRLELGMLLQIDAAVAYGVCLTSSQDVGLFCDVTQVNLVDNIPKDSEYNTYRRTGLPPTPIANPGLAALRAALDPLPSEFLYYLSARDGTTIFSRTAAEHARNRKRYLNI